MSRSRSLVIQAKVFFFNNHPTLAYVNFDLAICNVRSSLVLHFE